MNDEKEAEKVGRHTLFLWAPQSGHKTRNYPIIGFFLCPPLRSISTIIYGDFLDLLLLCLFTKYSNIQIRASN